MQTPIADFVRQYAESKKSRFHMPGHKGQPFLCCEAFDITEIAGADSLYEAEGIIAESEKNASFLFNTGRTVFGTEGSSQCIRAMLYLAVGNQKREKKPYVIAGRNVHKAFLYAAALLDFDIVWLWPEEMHSLCSCHISAEQLEAEFKRHKEPPAAVYITSPDYLGGQLSIRELAAVCHKYGTVLAVDNAHGAYLHFLEEKAHPMDLGADICCDSAHKTLPVLTGGAYLHISRQAPAFFRENAKQAMALFGSTSPSYLTMASLDLCNAYLADGYEERLKATVKQTKAFREALLQKGWKVEDTDPLKITLRMPKEMTGQEMAEKLRLADVECEYADAEYVVFMVTPENEKKDYERLMGALGSNPWEYKEKVLLSPVKCKKALSVREAFFEEHEPVPVQESLGRICASPTVGCPPAIPIVVSGEVINGNAISVFEHYQIPVVDVINRKNEPANRYNLHSSLADV